jgi:uncharacterized protein (DUF169 family)
MPSYNEIAQCLVEALSLAQSPVAVCLSESVPAGVEAWAGHSPAGCQFWQEAGARVFATSASDHGLCSIGVYTHNLEMTPAVASELGVALKVFNDLSYVRAEDVPMIPVLTSRPKHVIYGPLAQTPADPDVVLLFVRPDQTLIVSEASQQLEGNLPPAMGRPACAIIPQAINSGRSALSLGCCGARAYLDILSENVALYAIPGQSIAAFTERVVALSKANAVLTRFHQIRRRDVESGRNPTIQESLAAMETAG